MQKKFLAKKSLGQNFLTNRGVLRLIVEEANLHPDELILEIGPGTGLLTEALLKNKARVFAIEKDWRLISELEQKFATEIENNKFQIINEDALEVDYEKIMPKENYKIVANIPYYITGAILRKILSLKSQPSKIVLLVQKEVAKRIVANDKKESILSLSVKAYGKPKYVKTVSKGSFHPMPKVDSAILTIENLSKDFFKNISEKKFFEIIKIGFASKRKFLASNLKPFFNKNIAEVFSMLKINPKTRAEDLNLENWKLLTENLGPARTNHDHGAPSN